MKNILMAAGFAAAFAFAGTASAVTVTVLNTSEQGGGTTTNTTHTFGAGYNASTPAGATWSTPASIVNADPYTVNGQHKSPFFRTPLADSQTYFVAGGSVADQPVVNPAVLNFDTDQNNFDILWGSIDNYNTLSFWNDGSEVASFIGTEIFNAYTDPDAEFTSENVRYEEIALVNFLFGDNELFDEVRFASSTTAFEFALPVAAVPLPAAAWLMISAFAGLGFVARRRNKVA